VPIRRCRYAGAHDVGYWLAKKSTAAALAASSRCRSGPAGAAVAGAPTAAVRCAPAVARAASVSTSAASCPAAPAGTVRSTGVAGVPGIGWLINGSCSLGA
jgi:hypothetical protein